MDVPLTNYGTKCRPEGWVTITDFNTEAWSSTEAVFATADYVINEQWAISGGLRWTEDTKGREQDFFWEDRVCRGLRPGQNWTSAPPRAIYLRCGLFFFRFFSFSLRAVVVVVVAAVAPHRQQCSHPRLCNLSPTRPRSPSRVT